MKINKWFIFAKNKSYFLDFMGENLNETEIALCIEEQLFKNGD